MDIKIAAMVSQITGERHRLGVELNALNEVAGHIFKAREALDGVKGVEADMIRYMLVGLSNSIHSAKYHVEQGIEAWKEVI